MKSATASPRWVLCLGCLVIAALEAPEAGIVLAEDLGGPWRTEDVAAAGVPAGVAAGDPADVAAGAAAGAAAEDLAVALPAAGFRDGESSLDPRPGAATFEDGIRRGR